MNQLRANPSATDPAGTKAENTLTPSVLLERNQSYVDRHVPRGIAPNAPVVVVACVDARTDPAHVLGIDAGECLVYRNAGGRITPDVENELALLITMMKASGGPAPTIVVMHHHDCGLSRLTDPQVRSMLAGATGIAEHDLETRAIADPDASALGDLARIRNNAVLADIATVAMVFDPESGRVSEVAR
jgi:carbonic anhydrase